MRCEFVTPKLKNCTKKGKFEIDNIFYCSVHFSKMIKSQGKYHINESEYRDKVIETLNDENIKYDNIEFVMSDYYILVYKLKINNLQYICKIQFTDNYKSLFYDYTLVKKTLTDSDIILGLADIKNFYYKPNKYMIVISEPIICTLDSVLSILDNESIYDVTKRLVDIIEYIHRNKYMYLNLSIDKLVMTTKGVKILLYAPCTLYINCDSEFHPNSSINDMVGHAIYGSVNINSMFSGVRLDDIESILWINLKLKKYDIMDDISNATNIKQVVHIKEAYIEENKEKNLYIKYLLEQESKDNVLPMYDKYTKAISYV